MEGRASPPSACWVRHPLPRALFPDRPTGEALCLPGAPGGRACTRLIPTSTSRLRPAAPGHLCPSRAPPSPLYLASSPGSGRVWGKGGLGTFWTMDRDWQWALEHGAPCFHLGDGFSGPWPGARGRGSPRPVGAVTGSWEAPRPAPCHRWLPGVVSLRVWAGGPWGHTPHLSLPDPSEWVWFREGANCL